MTERYFADLDIHGEVIRFYPDDGKTRLHQNDARRIPVESVTFIREDVLSKAINSATSERDLLIRDLRKELNERRYGRSTTK